MHLPSDTRLGPYEIVAPLGAGGMGEVYRARDERLSRDVAVKVLPPGLAHDPDRLRRFEQEAKAAGSLNHPNILAVYDTGSHDGSPYVVSELLEGQTLRDRIVAGLSMRKAVEIGVQIARGLAAAHEKGIVHRDLKPENVFVTNEGHVKILDFGLAKLIHGETGAGSELLTLERETDPGTVMGTVGYMSPEQVRGMAVDQRSDIFSLGVILYELLSGRRAFKKETSAETRVAILREEPPPLLETNQSIPPALERIVAHCLEKNPQERFASARDLAFDLESAIERPGERLGSTPEHIPRLRRGMPAVAGWLAWTLAVAAAAYWVGARMSARAEPIYRQITFGRGVVRSACFSPDGASVLYSAAWKGAPPRVFATRLDLPGEQALGLEGDVVGAAAGQVAVLRADGTLVLAPLAGGGVREVATDIGAADWSRDGTGFAVARRAGAKQALEYPIGRVLHETVGTFMFGVRVSPDGGRVAAIETSNAGVAGSNFIVVVDGAGARRLTAGLRELTSLGWSPDGQEIWFTGYDPGAGWGVHAVSLSHRERLLLRLPHGGKLSSPSSDGRVLLALGQPRREVAGRGPGGVGEHDLTVLAASQAWDISEDGRRFVVSDHGPEGIEEGAAFLGSLDGAPLVRLGEGSPNSLSPDGQSVLVWRDREGRGSHLEVVPTGAGTRRPVPRGEIRSYFDARWLPDGRRILISGNAQARPRRLFLQELPGGLPRPITPEGVSTAYAYASPDGAWVAAGTDWRAAPFALYPLSGGDPRPIPGLQKGQEPLRFSADGRGLFVRHGHAGGDARARIDLLDLATGGQQPWKELGPDDPAGVSMLDYVYLTSDGHAYLYNYFRTLSDLFLVEGLK